MSDSVKLTFGMRIAPKPQVIPRDLIYLDGSGTFHIIKAGTVIDLPYLSEPVRILPEPQLAPDTEAADSALPRSTPDPS